MKEIFYFSMATRLRNTKERQRVENGILPIETNRNCTIFNRRFASRFPSEAAKQTIVARFALVPRHTYPEAIY